MSSKTPQPLNYAPRTNSRRRRRVRRIVGALILAIGVGAIWHWRGDIEDRATLWYWTRECRNFTAPADQIIFYYGSTDLVTRVLASDSSYQLEMIREVPAVRRINHGWNRLWELTAGQPLRTSSGGSRYASQRLIGKLPEVEIGQTIVFLHERVSPCGNRRLVVVRLFPGLNNDAWCDLDCESRTVSTFDGVGREVSSHRLSLSQNAGPAKIVLRSRFDSFCFFAGQPSSLDTSRFTIGYEFDGQSGTIDGQLLDDNRIRLTARDGPATNQAEQPTISNEP